VASRSSSGAGTGFMHVPNHRTQRIRDLAATRGFGLQGNMVRTAATALLSPFSRVLHTSPSPHLPVQAFVPRGNRLPPESSKITSDPITRWHHQLHRQALRAQRSQVDNRWGSHTRRWNGVGDTLLQHSYTHINHDLKGEQMRAERLGKINADNLRLVTHMEQILSRPPGDLALHSCDEAHGRGGADVFVARLRRSPQTFCSLESAWEAGGIGGGHPEVMQQEEEEEEEEEEEAAGSSSPEEQRAARPTTAPNGGTRSCSPTVSSSMSASGLPPPWKVHSAEINRRRKLAQIDAENAALVQRLAACRPLLSRAPWGDAGGPPAMPALTWAARVAQATCRQAATVLPTVAWPLAHPLHASRRGFLTAWPRERQPCRRIDRKHGARPTAVVTSGRVTSLLLCFACHAGRRPPPPSLGRRSGTRTPGVTGGTRPTAPNRSTRC